MKTLQQKLLETIKDYPDFPKQGIVFKDMMPVFQNPRLLKQVIRAMCEHAEHVNAEQIVGIESRGFFFGVSMAMELGVPYVPARKKGKLPGELNSVTYSLEYGEDSLEIQKGALISGGSTLIVDDVLATGGTAEAVSKLVTQSDAKVAGLSFLMELTFLEGRKRIQEQFESAELMTVLTL